MFYRYHVKYWDTDEEKMTTANGIITGATYKEVADKLADYYGEEEIEQMTLYFISDNSVLELTDEILNSVVKIAKV